MILPQTHRCTSGSIGSLPPQTRVQICQQDLKLHHQHPEICTMGVGRLTHSTDINAYICIGLILVCSVGFSCAVVM